MKEVEIARFGYLLGTLLQAGLAVNLALESLANATDFIVYRNFYLYLGKSIEEGYSFQKSFSSYKNTAKLIPTPILQLIIAGEKSGNLSKTLLKVGEMFEEKSDITTKNLTIILEPILLVFVWLGVVSVALAVILPIYGLVGGLDSPR
jgi:type II secretory pathway component PulF